MNTSQPRPEMGDAEWDALSKLGDSMFTHWSDLGWTAGQRKAEGEVK